MEKKEGRNAVGHRVYRSIIHLFRCQFSFEERPYVPMNILVIGLNHKTASVEIRERLAFTGPKLEEGLLAIRRLNGVNEAALLSTCNRVEIYASVSDIATAAEAVKAFISRFHDIGRQEFE